MNQCIQFIDKQVENFYPSTIFSINSSIEPYFEKTLFRFNKCVRNNKIFKNNLDLDPFHIMKYPLFLYLLSRVIHEDSIEDNTRLKDKIHGLNKALHGCSIFYNTILPDEFFFNYATGIVLAPAKYGNILVIYQGVNVTENNNILPIIGDNVTLMPGVIISGNSILGNNVTVSIGTKIVDKTIPSNSLVFQGADNQLVIKDSRKNYNSKYFYV